jgi:propanol-preferring alcohol dehydrogenase
VEAGRTLRGATMRAARLHVGERELRVEDVPVPEPRGDEVLVRVGGAGVCHSDLYLLDGMFDEFLRLPVTMGHEIAGWVEALGDDVRGLDPGEPVAVMVGWGCGACEWCVGGHEQLCPQGDEAGSTLDGGFAEYVLVPHRRHVVPLGDLDPVESAPLGDAALSPYAAVKRVRPHVLGGGAVVVVGTGGLGQYGVQIARELTGATVIAVDARADRLELARELGADHAVAAGDDAADTILELTRGRGAAAVVDLVGTDDSLALAGRVVGRRGIVVLLGLAGGTLPFGFYALAPEATLTTVYAGTIADLHEVVGLARAGRLRSLVERYPLARVNDALGDLRAGAVRGRAVVVPGSGA